MMFIVKKDVNRRKCVKEVIKGCVRKRNYVLYGECIGDDGEVVQYVINMGIWREPLYKKKVGKVDSLFPLIRIFGVIGILQFLDWIQ